ncbi:MAG: sulfite exporter TauE/SafE family protein [Chloroflexi bacterium]|jgi:uncharacterized protein|nr:sulfite exporter TauE/SafE family protein [Chloroflexota bacterium]MBT4003379.1 sulfite exporter TauE/SafE family protein [Chloroflexota bacterium]MBT4305926.1 sulfite exporter TauE/SafE family protein [Chloroflexota bacterium]MBT4533751.1 sulfite exporter TauE/SafE family protein [Chloroflexota bacterium]MBT4681606.1 sulfite exporter TauE/SafE family protein [Chloroflexota bacterium]
MPFDPIYFLIVVAGFIAGIINTLAGSGSLITLPILELLGLPLQVANGTNRIAILLQNIVGIRGFSEKKMLDRNGLRQFGIPSIIGWAIGSYLATIISPDLFRSAFGYIMVFMLFIILLRPKKWLIGEITLLENKPTISQYLLFFLIGIYGGFIQAGVGIFLLSGLVLGAGYNLIHANAVKVGIVLMSTSLTFWIFIVQGQVNFKAGFILAIGNMLGAWVGTKIAVEKGTIWIRRLLILIVTISSLKLLGIFELFN